jgi:hypothetical protein
MSGLTYQPGSVILAPAEFQGRREFARFLNRTGRTGIAVEVGTYRASFASNFIANWDGELLHCIDPWEEGYDDEDPASDSDMESAYRLARERLQMHRKRVKIHRMKSLNAVQLFEDKSVDFVYIDACHQYESVKTDIRCWFPKVVAGGIIAGHDFICPGEINGGWGQYIQPAVMNLARDHGLPVHLVTETDNSPWSFYLIKR